MALAARNFLAGTCATGGTGGDLVWPVGLEKLIERLIDSWSVETNPIHNQLDVKEK